MPISLRRRIFRGESSSGWVESCGGEQGERKKREGRRREARPAQASCASPSRPLCATTGFRGASLILSGRTRCAVKGVACFVIGSSQLRNRCGGRIRQSLQEHCTSSARPANPVLEQCSVESPREFTFRLRTSQHAVGGGRGGDNLLCICVIPMV